MMMTGVSRFGWLIWLMTDEDSLRKKLFVCQVFWIPALIASQKRVHFAREATIPKWVEILHLLEHEILK